MDFLITNNKVDLTQDQEAALEGLLDWSKTTDTVACLEGAAGTGKSFLLSIYLQKTSLRWGVVVTAPTHKAKLVAQQFTGKAGCTLQKLLGLKPNVDLQEFHPNQIEFHKKGEAQVKYYKLVIVDESSMVNDDLYDYLITLCENHGTKVLFVGDALQLKPVGQETLAKPFLLETNRFTLKETVRQKIGSPLSLPILALRSDLAAHIDYNRVDSSLFTTFVESLEQAVSITPDLRRISNNPTKLFKFLITSLPEVANNNEGYKITRNFHGFVKNMAEVFRDEDSDSRRALAFTNNKVRDYNTQIRGKIMKIEKPLVVGDILMGYRTTMEGVTNSQDYVVVSIEDNTHKGIDCYKVAIQDTVELATITVNIVKEKDYQKFAKYQQESYLYDRFGVYLDKIAEFDNLISYADVFPNGLSVEINDEPCFIQPKFLPKKSVDFALALTVHKSQGSTFESVFLDANEIIKFTRNDLDTMYRLLYVGASRASKYLSIFI